MSSIAFIAVGAYAPFDRQIVADVKFRAEYGFNGVFAVFFRLFIEFRASVVKRHRAIHIAVVGHGECGHS